MIPYLVSGDFMKYIHLMYCVFYYNLQFDDDTSFPKIPECIEVDKELHVQLQFNGNPYKVVHGTNARLSTSDK